MLASIDKEGHSMALQVGCVIKLISNENGARGGELEVGDGAGAFGKDGSHDIKVGCSGGGDGGVNGADRVCGAGSSNEVWAAGTGLLGPGRTGMEPKIYC